MSQTTAIQSLAADCEITERSAALFIDLGCDAVNWNGMPLFGGNVGTSPADKGNLTQLKKAGLVTTETDYDDPSLSWVIFTDKGITALAKHAGMHPKLGQVTMVKAAEIIVGDEIRFPYTRRGLSGQDGRVKTFRRGDRVTIETVNADGGFYTAHYDKEDDVMILWVCETNEELRRPEGDYR